MLKRVKDIAVIVRDGVKDGAGNLSGNLEAYFDAEMQSMLTESRTQMDFIEKEQVLMEIIICRDRMIRAEKRITIYGSLYFLLIALECVMMAGGMTGILRGWPGWVAAVVAAVETLLFWGLIGKQYRCKRRCSMKAEMLLERRRCFWRDGDNEIW